MTNTFTRWQTRNRARLEFEGAFSSLVGLLHVSNIVDVDLTFFHGDNDMIVSDGHCVDLSGKCMGRDEMSGCVWIKQFDGFIPASGHDNI